MTKQTHSKPNTAKIETSDSTNLASNNAIIKGTLKVDGASTLAGLSASNLSVTGNVGIGTDSPSAKLHVNGHAKVSGELMVIDKATNMPVLTVTAPTSHSDPVLAVTVPTSNTDLTPLSLLTILRNGNVGIGTDSPSANLEVFGNAPKTLGSTLRISNKGDGLGTESAIDFTTYDVGANLPSARILITDDGHYSNDISFKTKEVGKQNGELVTHMKITSDGNVGIGFHSPVAKLDVNGRIRDQTGLVMPVGSIIAFAGYGADGWLFCDGNEIPSQYTELKEICPTGKTPNLTGAPFGSYIIKC